MAWLVLVLAASLSLSLVRSQRIAEGEDGVFADIVASGSGLDDGALSEERVNSEGEFAKTEVSIMSAGE